jgi:cytochrome P450
MEMHAEDTFSEAFEFASAATGERFQNPLWQITEMFSGKRLRRSLAEVKRFGKTIVANAVQARIGNEADEGKGAKTRGNAISGSLIYSLLDSISDHQMVADAALNYLSAGRDTTAQALTWTFYLLMRQPHVVSRLHEEVSTLSIRTTDGISGLDSSSLQPKVLPYTMAVFYEALRLYPPVPFELKQCEQTTTLPDGTSLPRNAIVVWCTWAMNRSRLIWGEHADEFQPERWLKDGKLATKTAYEFPVFNGGPRTCLGKKMAECMGVMVIAKLIWEFDIVSVDGKERISRNSLTLPMEGGMPCYVTRRDRENAGHNIMIGSASADLS